MAYGGTIGLLAVMSGDEARQALGIDGGITESNAYTAGMLTGTLLTAGLGRLTAGRSTIRANAAQGKAGEAITRASLGNKIAGEQVSFKTSDGTRTRADFVTTDKSVVETKTGNATLSPGQNKLKADVDAGREVTPVGKVAEKAGLTPNVPVKMKCYRIDRPC
jgi:hypothetical protein